VISEHILEEIQRTLTKPYFSRFLTTEDQAAGMERFRRRATVVPITVAVEGVATQPGDDLVLATAVSGQVDYLVTRHLQLLALAEYEGVRIVSMGDFLAILAAEPST
jgi:predicted nucleic acid-binding protein